MSGCEITATSAEEEKKKEKERKRTPERKRCGDDGLEGTTRLEGPSGTVSSITYMGTDQMSLSPS